MQPKDDAGRVSLEAEKIQAWIAKGAQPTDRVLRFLDAAGLAKREARNNPQKAVPGKKAQERAAARLRPRLRPKARPRKARCGGVPARAFLRLPAGGMRSSSANSAAPMAFAARCG